MTSLADPRTTPSVPAPAASGPGEDGPRPGDGTGWSARVRGRPVQAAWLASSIALLGQVVGYALGWSGLPGIALVLWYVAFVPLVVPWVLLLLAPAVADRDRLRGGLGITVMMHLSWWLSAPVLATRFDETLHVTTLRMMTEGNGWFAPNPSLPISPHYPGLELATGGLVWLTGAPLVVGQVLVVVASRLVFVASLYWLATRITRSPRVGGLTVLLYAASVQFYFFNAQFSYQTLAIAMLMASMAMLLRAADSEQARPWRWMVAVQACLAALTVTHHLTSWITLGGLWALAVLFRLGGETRRARLTLVTAEVATAVTAAWTALIAPLLVFYLAPVVGDAGSQLLGVLSQDGSSRQLFADGGGVSTPLWEVGVMGLASLLWCCLLLPAVLVGLHRSTVGRSTARLLLLALAAIYPPLLLTRFSEAAAELGDRASTFVFMAMTLVIAAWIAPHLEVLARTTWLRVASTAAAVVLLLGGVILGNGPDLQRVPGPYLAGAQQRSVDAETVAVAQWVGRYLPAGSRVAADSTFARVLPNFADVVPVTGTSGSVDVTPLFIFPPVDSSDLDLLQEGRVDFVVVDTRMIGQTARIGSFFEGGSGYGPTAQTLTAGQLQQFAGALGFDPVLEGPVEVYDVRSVTGGDPTAFADRPAPGLPGGHSWWQLGIAGLVLALAGSVAREQVVRRRARGWAPRLEDLWPATLVLPGLIVVGAVAVAAGFASWLGSVVLVAAAGGGVVLARRRGLLLPGRDGAGSAPATRAPGDSWVPAIVLLIVTCVALASWAQYDNLFGAEPLPAPPAPTVSAPR